MFEDEFKEEAIPTEAAAPDAAPQEQPSPGVQLAPEEEAIPTGEAASPNVGGNKPATPGNDRYPAISSFIQSGVDIAEEGGVGPDGPIAKFAGHAKDGIKRIVSYLMGSDALPPEQLAAAAQSADPEGAMSPGERNLAAVAAARSPEEAWRFVQGQRVAFNAKQAFALAALTGTQGKPRDLRAAVDAANQAQAHVLDGNEVTFAINPKGVTATVNGRQIMMSPEGFRRYLDVGGEGQFDKLIGEGGIPAALQRIAQAAPEQRPQPQQQQQAPQRPRGEDITPKGEDITPKPRQELTHAQRAYEAFPWVSQGQDRSLYRDQLQEKEAERKAKVDVAKNTVDGRTMAATIGAQSRENVADKRGANAVEVQAMRGNTAVQVAQMKADAWRQANEAKRQQAMQRLELDYKRLASSNANSARALAMKDIIATKNQFKDLSPAQAAIAADYLAAAGAAGPVVRPGAQTMPQGATPQAPTPQAPTPQAPTPAAGAKPKPDRAALEAEMRRRGLL